MQTDHAEYAIDVRGLGKRFGKRWVLRGVTFDVKPGEAVGLMGHNGSGKSTVLRILATLLKPHAGSAGVAGHDVATQGGAVRGAVGYLAHAAGLYEDLTARESIRFAADMLGLPWPAADAALEHVGLAPVAEDRVRGFSAGMQRRLAVARLWLARPRVLLLDEPYANLDTGGVQLMNSLISSALAAGGAALVALHEKAPAGDLLSRVVRLVDGRAGAEALHGVA